MTSRDDDELKYYWKEWRAVSGNQYRDKYLQFIDIQNEGAKSLGKYFFAFFQDQNEVRLSSLMKMIKG